MVSRRRFGLETWRLVLPLGLRGKVRGHTTENQLCECAGSRDGVAPHVSRRKTAVRRLRRERAVGRVSGQKSDGPTTQINQGNGTVPRGKHDRRVSRPVRRGVIEAAAALRHGSANARRRLSRRAKSLSPPSIRNFPSRDPSTSSPTPRRRLRRARGQVPNPRDAPARGARAHSRASRRSAVAADSTLFTLALAGERRGHLLNFRYRSRVRLRTGAPSS